MARTGTVRLIVLETMHCLINNGKPPVYFDVASMKLFYPNIIVSMIMNQFHFYYFFILYLCQAPFWVTPFGVPVIGRTKVGDTSLVHLTILNITDFTKVIKKQQTKKKQKQQTNKKNQTNDTL